MVTLTLHVFLHRCLVLSGIVLPAPSIQAQGLFDSPWRSFGTGTPETGRYAVALAAGDLTGDGLADAVVGQNFLAPGVRVLLNQGTSQGSPATFEEDGGTLYPLSHGAWGVVLADLDGDGHLDIAATNTDYNFSGATVVVFLNSGDGTFGAPQSYPAGGPSVGITAADLNGDGSTDLAVANYGFFGDGSTVSVLRNRGNGTFLAPVSYPVGSGPYRLEAGDLDGDGHLDLVVARVRNHVSVLFNAGNGTFGAAVQHENLFPVVDQAAEADVALLDVDGDGDLDVAFTSNTLFDQGANEALVVLLCNDGSGVLAPELHYYGLPHARPAHDLGAVDLDGDGLGDLVGAQTFESGYVVLRSDGAGGFRAAEMYASVARLGESSGVAATALADLDGDGDADVLTVGRIRRLLSVHENQGDGTFPERPIFGRGSVHTVLDLGDVNGDGLLDAVASHGGASQSSVKVYLNGGDGTFSESYTTPQGGYAFAKLRDLDGDGRLDLLFVAGPAAPPYDFFTARGNGDGTFGPIVRWPVGACGLAHPGAFDLNGNGHLDVVLTENGACLDLPGSGRRLFVNLNNGDGTFQPPFTVVAGTFPYNLAAGDFDEDGHLDLVTSSQGSPALLLGNGDGTFRPEQPLATGRLGANILALDLDGDGHLDVVSLEPFTPGGQGDESYLVVLLGDGTGAFQRREYVEHLSQSFRNWVSAGDVDGDGVIDLVVGGVQDALVFLGDGLGELTFAGRYGIGQDAFAPHLADVSGDGRKDLVALVTHEMPASGLEQGLTFVRGLAGAPWQTYCTAKTTSLGCTPAIFATGSPGPNVGLPFVVLASPIPSQAGGTFFYTLNGRADAPFQGGTLCVASPILRVPVQNAGGNSPPSIDCSGVFSFGFDDWVSGGNGPALLPGTTVNGQYWFRDAGDPHGTGLSDAIEFVILP